MDELLYGKVDLRVAQSVHYVVFILGMLSKAKEQISRVATMHIPFHLEKDDKICDVIVDEAIN